MFFHLKALFFSFFLLFSLSFSSLCSAAEFEMVEYSAAIKLQWLAHSGLPEAQDYLKKLNKPNFFNKDNLSDFERIQEVNALFQEINYAAVDHFLWENGYSNVFDIACSYSPRVLKVVKADGHYVGAELAAVAFQADHLAKSSLDKYYYDQFAFEDVPAENEEIMLSATANFKGPICIVENGLMIYLNDYRLDSMLNSIKRILKHNGGCFITTDFALRPFFLDCASALYGEKNAETLYEETKLMYESVLEDEVEDSRFWNENQAVNYLESLGFKVEKVPLLPADHYLNSYGHLSQEQRAKINALTGRNYLWVITPTGGQ